MIVRAVHPVTGRTIYIDTTTGQVKDENNRILETTYDPKTETLRLASGATYKLNTDFGGRSTTLTPVKTSVPIEEVEGETKFEPPHLVDPDTGAIGVPNPTEPQTPSPPNNPDIPPTPETPDPEDEATARAKENLLAYIEDIFAQYGLNTPGLLEFARNAIALGWDANRIMIEIRKHPDYLADPLRAANMDNARSGRGFMPEGQLIAYKNEARRLATQYGFAEPSDNYIALNISAGRSLAEYEHRLQIQRNVDTWGAGVRLVMQDELGIDMSDQDLYELFDPEIDTQEWNDAYRRAQMRGRPFLLGLGIRSETEARALEMLGVDPEEAWRRYQSVAQNASRFDRLAAIEENVSGKLPANFGDFSAADNSMLVRAIVFQDPTAQAELQQLVANEIARFNTGGGPFATSTGQQLGLLTADQRG